MKCSLVPLLISSVITRVNFIRIYAAHFIFLEFQVPTINTLAQATTKCFCISKWVSVSKQEKLNQFSFAFLGIKEEFGNFFRQNQCHENNRL